MKELLWKMVLVVFVMIAVFVTICTLSTNDYNVMQFGNKIWIIAGENLGDYSKNTLLIIKEDNRNVKLNDEVFFYAEDAKGNKVKYGQITAINNNSYTINNEEIEKSMVISSNENVKKVAVLGTILSILTSRYGYLCLIILPILVAFVYQIVLIAKELGKDTKSSKKTKKTK